MCYMNTDSFIVYIKTDNLYKDIVEDVGTRFATPSYELNRSLPKGKNKKVFSWINERLIMWKIFLKSCWITSKNL